MPLSAMLETIKCEVDGYLNPEVDMAEITRTVTQSSPVYMNGWSRTFSLPALKPNGGAVRSERPGGRSGERLYNEGS